MKWVILKFTYLNHVKDFFFGGGVGEVLEITVRQELNVFWNKIVVKMCGIKYECKSIYSIK